MNNVETTNKAKFERLMAIVGMTLSAIILLVAIIVLAYILLGWIWIDNFEDTTMVSICTMRQYMDLCLNIDIVVSTGFKG